jgi:1-acyl-sn-glycerol-3-phosphate acyltransferase
LTAAALAAVRVPVKMLALALLIVAIAPAQALLLLFSRGPASMRMPPLFHRGMCALLGLRVELAGAPVREAQAVFIGNHLSYLDIPVLGSVLSACFVAKDEVRAWPVFGALARLQHTVFISRKARDAHAAAGALSTALAAGHRLVLFPEGTTSDGSSVLPFKSSIFALLADPALAHVQLQPISLELLEVDGRAIGGDGQRDRYAYYGDMHLLPHLLAFMRLSGARLRVHFHAPLPRLAEESRKQLAARAYQAVAQVAAG